MHLLRLGSGVWLVGALIGCNSVVTAPTPAPLPSTIPPSPTTDPVPTAAPTPTADTGPPCTPRGVPGPDGVPVLVVSPMSELGEGATGHESDLQGDPVFLYEDVVGFGWSQRDPFQHYGAMWWSAAQMPVPAQVERQIAGRFLPLGDVTGDGIRDAMVHLHGEAFADGLGRRALLPGPLAAISHPVHLDPAASLWVDDQWTNWDYVGHPFRCGDLNGDGKDEVCGHMGVDLGPPDGVVDHVFDPALGAERNQTLSADMNHDGIDELYTRDGGGTRRLAPLPGVISLPAEELGFVPQWVLDLDGAGDQFYARQLPDSLVSFATDPPTPLSLPSFILTSLVSGDFDGDGVQEIALVVDEQIRLFEQDGTERLRIEPAASNTSISHFGRVLEVGDVDGNGLDDLGIGAPASEYGKAYFVFDPLACATP